MIHKIFYFQLSRFVIISSIKKNYTLLKYFHLFSFFLSIIFIAYLLKIDLSDIVNFVKNKDPESASNLGLKIRVWTFFSFSLRAFLILSILPYLYLSYNLIAQFIRAITYTIIDYFIFSFNNDFYLSVKSQKQIVEDQYKKGFVFFKISLFIFLILMALYSTFKFGPNSEKTYDYILYSFIFANLLIFTFYGFRIVKGYLIHRSEEFKLAFLSRYSTRENISIIFWLLISFQVFKYLILPLTLKLIVTLVIFSDYLTIPQILNHYEILYYTINDLEPNTVAILLDAKYDELTEGQVVNFDEFKIIGNYIAKKILQLFTIMLIFGILQNAIIRSIIFKNISKIYLSAFIEFIKISLLLLILTFLINFDGYFEIMNLLDFTFVFGSILTLVVILSDKKESNLK